MTETQPQLVCRDLRKRYGDRTAVDGISFEIAPGETYGLLGPNGAGKTTTISMICGLLRRDGGEVVAAGRPVDIGATEAKASIGYVPQDLAIYPDLTARENLVFFGRLQRMGGRDLARRVDEILVLTDLTDRAKDRVDSFSGGMKRRLNIGIGLLHKPALLVLDEPTVGVDPQSRNAILVERRGSQPRGDGGPLHDPLHGGGRAAVRPHRDHRRGPDQGRGNASRTGRPGRPEGPR
jgi:ABC-2 type transport system ATP-binding protein